MAKPLPGYGPFVWAGDGRPIGINDVVTVRDRFGRLHSAKPIRLLHFDDYVVLNLGACGTVADDSNIVKVRHCRQ